MANTAHLMRRQSSRDLYAQRSIDRMEMKELRGRLVTMENGHPILRTHVMYGATNQAFEDTSPNRRSSETPTSKASSENERGVIKPEGGGVERESWDSKLTFLLATVGYAVGLGNVWRFPYLAQKNGGGAFLIPYFVMLAIEGIPIFYLELAIGQRLRKGAIGVWHQVSPYLGGIGISSAVVSFNVALYYNSIIAWCLFYFVQSFQAELPWSECPRKYFSNGSYTTEPECAVSSPTQYFWYRTTLQISEDINYPETFNYKIALALIVAWILVYMCMIKGIASSGKVVYVTATFPYIVLVIFFFRGITLKGMGDGLIHLFTPKWHKILDPVVWLEAGTQIFFSLGLAFGGLIAFSSYNPVDNNCYRDAIMVSMTNCLTSMFAGIVVFSIIGFKATMVYEKCLELRNETLLEVFGSGYRSMVFPEAGQNVTVDLNGNLTMLVMPSLPECDLQKELDNTASGTGLAFIIFTEAINQFPGAQFWSVLFFLMLFTLGIDSQFGTLEGVVTSIVDMKLFPNLRKEYLTGGLCLICCLLSMAFAHGSGSYIFLLFDMYSGNFPLLIIAFFECIGIAYVYGVKRFADDIELMTGQRPGIYWMICWKYLSPLAMLSILVSSFVELAMEGSSYEAWIGSEGDTVKKPWPIWAVLLVLVLILASVLWIPGLAIFRYFGIPIIDDEERAWFPADDLRDFHGIEPRPVSKLETLLFCTRPDGSEGCCWPGCCETDDEE
ncbi:sodium-dependent neutral amino acid transporter B(0)AT3 [Maniola hyperantus]|uniref:sodium-dependent neutral amino acid transporter B(0)AT3 n=1 Tax=Aphantopus hyperantus TaxID=2795564 RepID=UPI00156874D7|nr:sodium-dependent neutral amino acid transporter B(0)AT3 [Maniola hyperantus]